MPRDISVNVSGEIGTAKGKTLITAHTVLAPHLSGGIVLGSGKAERVIIKVPRTVEVSDGLCPNWCNSGLLVGIWIGGRSGTGEEPIPMSGTLLSGRGLFVEPGDQKELFVQRLEEIHVAGMGMSGCYPALSGIYGSGVYQGFPVTYLGEIYYP